MFGGPGSGKSTEALRLSQYLAENHGRVLYNSHEEGWSATLQQRVVNNNITSSKIGFADRMPFQDMIEKAKRGRYRFVVVDSLQYMGFTYAMYKQFVDRCPRKGLIVISQINGRGSIKGGTDILHAVDIKAEFKNGYMEVRSRFLSGGYSKTKLFDVRTNGQINLF